jgi:hypothetical protein
MTSSSRLVASIIAELKNIYAATSKEDLFKLQKDFQALNLNESNFMGVKIQANIRALDLARCVVSQSPSV